MASASLMTFLQNEIELLLGQGISAQFPRLDVFGESILSTRGVTPREMSQGFKVRKVFSSGVAGKVEMNTDRSLVTGNSITTIPGVGDTTTSLHSFQDAPFSYPSGDDARDPGSFSQEIDLQAAVGTLRFTAAEFRANDLEALVHDIIARKITGWARNIARIHLNYFWTDKTGFALGLIGSVPSAFDFNGNGTPTTNPIAVDGASNQNVLGITLGSTSSSNRLEVGMNIDIHSGTSTTRRNEVGGVRKIVVVSSVDYLTNTAILVSPAAEVDATWNMSTVAAGDGIYYSNSYTAANPTVGFSGLNSWIKSTGTLFNINLVDHPEFKSLLTASQNGPLTENLLNRNIATWKRAFWQFGHTVDTAVTTWGVMSAMSKQFTGITRVERNGSPLNLKGQGVQEGIEYVFDGAAITFRLSNFAQPGTCYIVKTRDQNWKRVVPPSSRRSSNGENIPQYAEWEFIGTQVGWPTNRIPVRDSTGHTTDTYEMPGHGFTTLTAEQPSSIKITGLTEDYVTAL